MPAGAPTTESSTDDSDTDDPDTDSDTPTQTTEESAAPVVDAGMCSDELLEYMSNSSTSTTFVPGFGLPALLDGLPVGCAGVAPAVSFAGYLDTFAFISVPDPAARDAAAVTLDQRILGLGYTADQFAANVYLNAAGDPERFLRLLSDDDESELADAETWPVVHFYLSG